jgi:hypothetical protein
MSKDEIDVFGYLEEIVIKKDLDDFDWFYSGYSKEEQKEIEKHLGEDPDSDMEIIMRSDCHMETLSRNLRGDLIAWVETGEKIGRQKAVKEVDKFIADLSKGCKKEIKSKK